MQDLSEDDSVDNGSAHTDDRGGDRGRVGRRAVPHLRVLHEGAHLRGERAARAAGNKKGKGACTPPSFACIPEGVTDEIL